MGTSNWQNISYNIELARKLNPQTILDVGVGFGRWGILFREFLEIWESNRYDGNWQRRIEGIEIFPGYIKEYHRYFYDEIHLGNALEFLKTSGISYDLINFGDVIEHFEKAEGEEMLKLAVEKARFVLINIPIGKYWAQEGTKENPFEAHRSVWYNSDFTKFKYHKIKTFYDLVSREYSVVLLSRNRIVFNKRFGKFFRIKSFLKHRLFLKRLIELFERSRQNN